MFTIRSNQIEVFKSLSLKKFEDELVVHVNTYFPTHYMIIGEDRIRDTIRYAYRKAGNYGFTTKRNVCLYLNNMLIFGSNFDLDPQYSWAQEILGDKKENDPANRIDALSDKGLELISRITGPEHLYLNRALLNLHKNADQVFAKLTNSSLKGPLFYMNSLYPKKCEVIGPENLGKMEILGTTKARKYGITYDSNIPVFILCMFMLGSDFDKDPQFPWATAILNDPAITGQREKIELLYKSVISSLRSFIFKINIQ